MVRADRRGEIGGLGGRNDREVRCMQTGSRSAHRQPSILEHIWCRSCIGNRKSRVANAGLRGVGQIEASPAFVEARVSSLKLDHLQADLSE